MTWGSDIEIERKRRIDVAAAAYAYEVDNDPIMDDDAYDFECLMIDPTVDTGNKRLDRFFREVFEPDTGLWIHKHPNLAGVRRVLAIKRKVV